MGEEKLGGNSDERELVSFANKAEYNLKRNEELLLRFKNALQRFSELPQPPLVDEKDNPSTRGINDRLRIICGVLMVQSDRFEALIDRLESIM